MKITKQCIFALTTFLSAPAIVCVQTGVSQVEIPRSLESTVGSQIPTPSLPSESTPSTTQRMSVAQAQQKVYTLIDAYKNATNELYNDFNRRSAEAGTKLNVLERLAQDIQQELDRLPKNK